MLEVLGQVLVQRRNGFGGRTKIRELAGAPERGHVCYFARAVEHPDLPGRRVPEVSVVSSVNFFVKPFL